MPSESVDPENADGNDPKRNSDAVGHQAQLARIQRMQSYAGLVFVATSIIAFCGAVYFVIKFDAKTVEPQIDGNAFSGLISAYPGPSVLIVAALLGAILGRGLLSKAVEPSIKTIPDGDRAMLEPLISDHNTAAISEYVRIIALSGSTGFFTKLGFTGLPLVTAALGLLLILLAMISSVHGDDLLDLAKLVIGAFIGSFVQKKVAQKDSDLPENMI